MTHEWTCGCTVINNARFFCRQHSERNPPPRYHEVTQGGTPDPRPFRSDPTVARMGVSQPEGEGRQDAPRFGRKRWNPESGELED